MPDNNPIDKNESKLNTELSSKLIIEDEEPTAPGWSKKDIKHNIIVMVMLITIFDLGWDDFTLALQPFLAHLHMSNKMVGLVNGLTIMAIPGLLLSPFISRRLRIKKLYAFLTNMLYLLMIGLLGFGIVFSDKLGLTRETLILLTVVLMVSHQFIAGFVSLPVQEFVAACIPMSFRGRYNGISYTTGAIAGLGTTAVGGWILLTQPKPMSFGYLFLMTWILGSLAWTAGLFAKEKPTNIEKVPIAWSKEMLKSVWDNKPFVRLTIVTFVAGSCFGGGSAFMQQYAYRELHMPAWNSAIFQSIILLGRLATAIPAGLIVDKYGPKRFIPYWGIITAIGLSFAIFFHNKWGVYLQITFNLTALCLYSMSRSILAVSLPKPEHRAGTYTVASILAYAGTFVSNIIGGTLCDKFGYRPTFIICAVGAILITPAYFWGSIKPQR